MCAWGSEYVKDGWLRSGNGVKRDLQFFASDESMVYTKLVDV